MRKLIMIHCVIFVLMLCCEAHADVLAVYFSRSGNTQRMTEIITKRLGETLSVDVFRIEPAEPYPEDYTAMTELAMTEQNANARPALAQDIGDISKYDTILLGYPIWWGDIPMIICTFLEGHDFTGKRVIPYNTHGGSGKGRSISSIKEILSGVSVDDGFAVNGSSVSSSEAAIISWVDGLNITQNETSSDAEPEPEANTTPQNDTPAETTAETPSDTVTQNETPADSAPEAPSNTAPQNETPAETTPNTTANEIHGSSGGGCSSGFAAVILLAVCSMFRKHS